DRGLLREGMYADVMIFNPNTIIDRATYEQPHQLSVGVMHVLVNGVPVVSDGKVTGAKPGRLVRGPGYHLQPAAPLPSRELDALLHELAHWSAADLRRLVARSWDPFTHCVRERRVRRLEHLHASGLDDAGGVHNESDDHGAGDTGRSQKQWEDGSRVARAG